MGIASGHHFGASLRRIVIFQDGATGLVGVVILTRKNGPPQHHTDERDNHQRQWQQEVENFQNAAFYVRARSATLDAVTPGAGSR